MKRVIKASINNYEDATILANMLLDFYENYEGYVFNSNDAPRSISDYSSTEIIEDIQDGNVSEYITWINNAINTAQDNINREEYDDADVSCQDDGEELIDSLKQFNKEKKKEFFVCGYEDLNDAPKVLKKFSNIFDAYDYGEMIVQNGSYTIYYIVDPDNQVAWAAYDSNQIDEAASQADRIINKIWTGNSKYTKLLENN